VVANRCGCAEAVELIEAPSDQGLQATERMRLLAAHLAALPALVSAVLGVLVQRLDKLGKSVEIGKREIVFAVTRLAEL
jgi:hypothetical protein